MPCSETRIFCTWEVVDGTDQKVLQDYLDNEMVTKACCNALIPMNRKMNPDTSVFKPNTSEAVPYDGVGDCF